MWAGYIWTGHLKMLDKMPRFEDEQRNTVPVDRSTHIQSKQHDVMHRIDTT